ncbi:MAG: PAS domain S-box protein [Bacteroidetes bacterium]|nr:PAS domain S-box protein [Bacteroidota bacterium]
MGNSLIFGADPAHNYEHAFRRLEAAYQTLFDIDSDAILVVRASDGKILEANNALIKLLGYPENQIPGMSLSTFMCELPDAFSPDAEESRWQYEQLFMQETIWKHHDGHEIPIRVSMKRIEAPGEFLFMVIACDITELKKKDVELITSDARYFNLVENSGEGLGNVDTEERFTFVNPAACEIFGLSKDEMIGKCLNSFLDPHSMEEIELQSAKRKEGLKSIYELEIIRPDGERRWIIVTATPQYDVNQNFTGTFGIFRDITERKHAEMLVRESEQRLHEIVDLTNDWIWEVDPKWKYTYVSVKVFEILGYRPEEMIGMSPFDFLLPEDIEHVKMGIRTVVHEFKPLNALINRARHKDGHFVYLETSGIAVFNQQGQYQGYRGADRDITLRTLYERELIVAKEKAEESDRLKSSILANMSHEFRTPLNGILGFAEILKEELSNSEYESMIDNIYNSGQRLMATLNSIITLSQLEAGKVNVSGKSILLGPTIVSVVNSMQSLITEKKISIDTSGIKEVSVNTDDHLFKQLLQQILDNAIKFTDKGGITIETNELTQSGKKWVVVQISDTGIGIDKTYFEFIFQEFRQVSEGFGRKYQGSGIGLTISKKIIDLLHGRITIESEPGKGSCFSIWLPGETEMNTIQAAPLPAGDGLPRKVVSSSSESLPLILLVEDNVVNKELTILFLRNTCKVDYAPDAATAIEKAGSVQYRLILMDINLGYGMSGIEATREIRNIPGYAQTPIIAVTGYTMAEDKEQLFAAGCTSHIAKPFDKQTLLKMIQEALSGN